MMRLALATAVVLLVAQSALAVGTIRIPSLGLQDLEATRIVTCATNGDEVEVEVRFYDFTPPDDSYWRSITFALPGEDAFVSGVSESPGEPAWWYIDVDRDGMAEERVTFNELRARAEYSLCNIYLMYRHGRP